MSDKVRIVRIEAGEGAKITKHPNNPHSYAGNHYEFPIVYVLEDGQRIETRSHHDLLRDAKAELASMPVTEFRDEMSACFFDGKYCGTQTSVYIGPRDAEGRPIPLADRR